MAIDWKSEFNRPVPIALAALAVVGWIVAISDMSSLSSLRQSTSEQLQRAAAEQQRVSGELTALQKASGTLADVQKKTAAAEAAATEANKQRAAAGADYDALRKNITTAQQSLAETKAQADDQEQRLGEAKRQLDETGQHLTQARQDLVGLNDQIAAAEHAADDAAAKRDQTQTEVNTAIDKLHAEQAQAEKDAADAQAKLADLQRQLAQPPAEQQQPAPAQPAAAGSGQ